DDTQGNSYGWTAGHCLSNCFPCQACSKAPQACGQGFCAEGVPEAGEESLQCSQNRNTVDGCIHRAAGPLLKEECRTLSGCETGKAKISCGYRLPAKFVIHTVGPIAQGQPSAAQATELSDCYKNSLKLAVENKLRTVAFPCISTGVFGYPNDAAAEVVLNTLRKWLEENKEKVREEEEDVSGWGRCGGGGLGTGRCLLI
uniref:Mono-ADP ribosylhydrolase 1 n=1 Tax=Podarcis muralis TaxID=64176 RepID=A0A670JVK5_PODMU